MSEITLIPFERMPARLQAIYDAPEVLHCRGSLPEGNVPTLAVVGSRKPTSYGESVVAHLLAPAAQAGAVIVSGLAYGIDKLAHEAALQNGARTLAVLGCGVDDGTIYPSAHRKLAQTIVEQGGAVLSEYPDGTPPLPHHFPLRNRIIAGLSDVVLIVEAGESSGSLITGELALQEGREVCVVPGSIFSANSKGTHRLLKMGAWPITEPEDLLEILGLDQTQPSLPNLNLSDIQVKILENLSPDEAVHLDELQFKLQLTAQELSMELLQLEIQGIVFQSSNMQYLKKPNA